MGWLPSRLLCVLCPQLSLQTGYSHINKDTLFHASAPAADGKFFAYRIKVKYLTSRNNPLVCSEIGFLGATVAATFTEDNELYLPADNARVLMCCYGISGCC